MKKSGKNRFFGQRRRPAKRLRKAKRINFFECLEARDLLAADLSSINAGLTNGFFSDLQAELNSDVLAAPLPLIGGQLATATEPEGQFVSAIDGLLDGFYVNVGATISEVKTELASNLGALLFGGESGIQVSGLDGSNEISFQFTLTDSIVAPNAFDLKLTLDGTIDARLDHRNLVDATIDWELDVAFVVTNEGFRFVTSAADELTVDVVLDVDPTSFKGTIGIFAASFNTAAQTESTSQTFTGTYTVDIVDGNSDGLMPVSEFDQVDTVARVSGTGDIQFHYFASFFPSAFGTGSDAVVNLAVAGEAKVKYALIDADPDVFDDLGETLKDFGEEIVVTHENVELDLGKFYNEFLLPNIKKASRCPRTDQADSRFFDRSSAFYRRAGDEAARWATRDRAVRVSRVLGPGYVGFPSRT